MIRTEMRQFPLDNGASSKEINNPFHGKVSQRVIIGILQTTSFNAQYDKDTFVFGIWCGIHQTDCDWRRIPL